MNICFGQNPSNCLPKRFCLTLFPIFTSSRDPISKVLFETPINFILPPYPICHTARPGKGKRTPPSSFSKEERKATSLDTLQWETTTCGLQKQVQKPGKQIPLISI